MLDDGDELLTMKQVCEFFGGKNRPLDPSTIWRWVKIGKLAPPERMTARYRAWRLSDCEKARQKMVGL